MTSSQRNPQTWQSRFKSGVVPDTMSFGDRRFFPLFWHSFPGYSGITSDWRTGGFKGRKTGLFIAVWAGDLSSTRATAPVMVVDGLFRDWQFRGFRDGSTGCPEREVTCWRQSAQLSRLSCHPMRFYFSDDDGAVFTGSCRSSGD